MPQRRVLLEVKLDRGVSHDSAMALARRWARFGFVVDETYRAVPMSDNTLMIRGTLGEHARLDKLQSLPQLVGVWDDAPIAPTGKAA